MAGRPAAPTQPAPRPHRGFGAPADQGGSHSGEHHGFSADVEAELEPGLQPAEPGTDDADQVAVGGGAVQVQPARQPVPHPDHGDEAGFEAGPGLEGSGPQRPP